MSNHYILVEEFDMKQLAGIAATVSTLGALAIAISPQTLHPSRAHHANTTAYHVAAASEDDPKPLAPFAERALDWLAAAQSENGGWGAGSHSRQDIRDPHAVSVDPATTAFAALALVRSGNGLSSGPYRDNVKRALDYLLDAVEAYPEEGAAITNISGTQPQAKLGQNIDASMTAQFLTRMLKQTSNDKRLHARVESALNKCLRKLQRAQQADGSFNGSGWAPVLQSAMANSAFEMASNAGQKVDQEVLDRSRAYQSQNVNEDGSVRTEAAAGVDLYSVASNQRALAADVRKIRDKVDTAKREGQLRQDADISEENLAAIGYSDDEAKELASSYRRFTASSELLTKDDVLAGFGNNGGEEFLSYMMTAEALAAAGGNDWDAFHDKMSRRLEKVQNQNGSWSGHHCITSPTFSTAAVVMMLTADRDLDLIKKS
jgi:hypothetical protein